jgi:ubiquitin-like modifier-activating enzyme ATG7
LPGDAVVTDPQRPGVVGWEKNAAGKLGARLADLGPMMDPRQ